MSEIITLAKNIKKIRRTLNLSQIEFAADCGISTESVSRIERCVADPQLSTLQAVASYINCDVADLLVSREW